MKVVIGVEDKVYGEAIIEFIGKQSWEQGSSFELIHVVDDEPVGDQISDICCDSRQVLLDAERNAGQELLMDLDLKLIKAIPNAVTQQKLVFGKPKERLLEELEEQQPDMLIVGSHGRTGFKRFLLGSVSMSLLSQAPCTVLIVKLPKPSATPSQADAQPREAVKS